MAATDTIQQFKAYVQQYIVDHSCFGQTSLVESGVEFVPRCALEKFWDRNRIINVLCSGEERISADIKNILEHYLVVFSILVSLPVPRPKAISIFTDISLDDVQLPLSATPAVYRDAPEYNDVLEDFQKHQWRFCPLTFDRGRRYNGQLNAYHILPITSKILLDPEADEEDDDVLLYEAQWHPLCQGFLPSQTVTLKEYRNRDPKVREMFKNEVDVYASLDDEAFEYIIGYFGSFAQQGKSTIILEHANGGSLTSFFKSASPPYKPCDRAEFWKGFFRLLSGLHVIHNLNPATEHPRRQWLLKGIHQDIRPQNILLIIESPANPYSVRFKLTDFGTGHVRRCRAQGLDALGAQRVGNGMYSAPDSRRDDNIPKPQLCECDIWSLGGVASETLVWSILGERRRRDYQDRRSKITNETPLKGGYHEGSFHDGTCRLDIVDNEHGAVLEAKHDNDVISPLVSGIILKHMLMANPSERSNAIRTLDAWEAAINGVLPGGNDSPTTPRASYSSARVWPSQRQSTNSTLSQAAEAQRYRNHEPWLPHEQLLSAEPAAMSPPRPTRSLVYADLSPPAYGAESARRGRNQQHRQSSGSHDQFWRGNGNPGPSTLRGFASTRGRRGGHTAGYDAEPFGATMIPEDAGDQSRPAPSSSLRQFPLLGPRPASAATPPRQFRPELQGWDSSPSSRGHSRNLSYPRPRTRQSVDDHYEIQEGGMSSSMQQGTGLGIEPNPRARRGGNPVSTNERADTLSTLRQSISTLPPEPFSIITIDDIFTRCIKPGDKARLRRKDPLVIFPELKRALEKLKGYEGRDQVIVIDDADSMYRYKDQLGKTVRVLARVLKSGKVDPNKTIDLYYTCSSETYADSQATRLQNHVDGHDFSDRPCDIFSSLDEIATQVLKNRNPVSIYVLTNGRWDAEAEDDLCKVDQVIRRILNSVRQSGKQSNHVGIQFIRFYRGNDAQDEIARKRLEYLDNCLEERFKELNVAKGDIVDTVDWDGDVRKMLLGGVFSDSDRLDSLSPRS